MPDVRPQDHSVLGDELDRLTSEFAAFQLGSPGETMERLCSRLATIDPISSAGMFRVNQSTSSLEWLYRSRPVNQILDHSLVHHREGLTNMLNNGDQLIQLDGNGKDFFTGFSAGQYDGAAIGLGVSSGRHLERSELSRMVSFSLLLGLMAENARLKQLAATEDTGSTARLIGFIAHELRTPLTGMRGNIQLALMASRKQQHDRIPTRLEAAIQGVDSMSGLVQQLLDVSRLERGAFTLTISSAQIGDTVSRAVEAQPEPERNIRVTGDVSTPVSADHESLEKVIYFLLKTVSGYADRSETTVVTAHRGNGDFGIDITYVGPPLSEDDYAALTAPLSRTGASPARSSENLSLELAYCRGIIHQHDGEITLAPETPQPGQQTIGLRFPDSADA